MKKPLKIVFFGDSITDARRNRELDDPLKHTLYGSGFVFLVASQLFSEDPRGYEILNRGIAGNRLPQMYARIQLDVWNEMPDVLNILIGVNDIPHDNNPNPTDLERWTRMYCTLIEETKERCPDIKIIICEPFTLLGSATSSIWEQRNFFVRQYAARAKEIAEKYGLPFVSLQDKFDEKATGYGTEPYLFDGIHPNIAGAKLIAEEWLKTFRRVVNQE